VYHIRITRRRRYRKKPQVSIEPELEIASVYRVFVRFLGGGPGQSPTADLRVRSALLYATELPGHVWLVYREALWVGPVIN
jgi:hypothetical protein